MTVEGRTAAEWLVHLAREHPDWGASDHARAIGISRERVRQLRVQLGLTLPDKRGTNIVRKPRPDCSVCGQPVRTPRATRHIECPLPSRYGVPARSLEYQRQWQRAYQRRLRQEAGRI